jgi:pyrroloquinoline quinone (PQQ) biosynthesis protein C
MNFESNYTNKISTSKKPPGFSSKSVQKHPFEYSSNLADAEWVHIAPDKIVMAINGQTSLIQPSLIESPNCFTQPMNFSGSISTTRQLLDGAIAAAKFSISSTIKPPILNEERWIWRLAGLYHQTHFVPQLMEEASLRFAKAGCQDLAQWSSQKAYEERGHDLLALQDIRSLKYDAEAVVKALFPPAAKALINYLTRSVHDLDPIDCVGYVYTMERLALGIDQEYIQKIEALLPPGVNASRCLHVHSNVGADVEHVEETIEMVANLAPKKLSRVAISCYETALLCFSPPNTGYISNEELQQKLSLLKSK